MKGVEWKRHVDQLQARVVDLPSADEVTAPEEGNILLPSPLAVNGTETNRIIVHPFMNVINKVEFDAILFGKCFNC